MARPHSPRCARPPLAPTGQCSQPGPWNLTPTWLMNTREPAGASAGVVCEGFGGGGAGGEGNATGLRILGADLCLPPLHARLALPRSRLHAPFMECGTHLADECVCGGGDGGGEAGGECHLGSANAGVALCLPPPHAVPRPPFPQPPQTPTQSVLIPSRAEVQAWELSEEDWASLRETTGSQSGPCEFLRGPLVLPFCLSPARVV